VDAESKMSEAVTAQKELKKQVEELKNSGQLGEDNLRRLHAEMEELRQEKANLEVREGGGGERVSGLMDVKACVSHLRFCIGTKIYKMCEMVGFV